ncbi:MAG TPA: nitrogenase component 1, partial [Mariprofundaceae bacterium]|nr:nitrogenase component 1 [Mariprofundaceae bacterium]
EFVKDTIERFGMRPLVLPDISESLDGHLGDNDFSPVTTGGTPVEDIVTMGESAVTLVIGNSLNRAADLLKARTGVPDFRFDSLMGLNNVDKLMLTLKEISGTEVPARIERQRSQLQDAMLDSHFMLGQSKVIVAADPDLLYSFTDLMRSMGGDVIAAVAPARAEILEQIQAATVKIGDLEDAEKIVAGQKVDLIIGNSHAGESARRLGCQLLRAGFPQYDLLGGFQRTWIGYAGTRQALFDLANLMTACGKGEIEAYHSIYSQKEDDGLSGYNGGDYAVAAAVAGG